MHTSGISCGKEGCFRNRLRDTGSKLLPKRGGVVGAGEGDEGEGDEAVQTSGYKINKSQGCDVQHRKIVDNIVTTLYGDR